MIVYIDNIQLSISFYLYTVISRKAKKEKNRLLKEEIEKKYDELQAMQKEMNKYADLSDEEEENEE